MRVSVIGGGTVGDETYEQAREVGRSFGERGHTVVYGGLGGVMAAACAGAASEGGRTIGILPTERRADANDHVETAIATGLGHGRNHLVVLNGDAAIAVDGGGGTLSEIGFAHVYDRPPPAWEPTGSTAWMGSCTSRRRPRRWSTWRTKYGKTRRRPPERRGARFHAGRTPVRPRDRTVRGLPERSEERLVRACSDGG